MWGCTTLGQSPGRAPFLGRLAGRQGGWPAVPFRGPGPCLLTGNPQAPWGTPRVPNMYVYQSCAYILLCDESTLRDIDFTLVPPLVQKPQPRNRSGCLEVDGRRSTRCLVSSRL